MYQPPSSPAVQSIPFISFRGTVFYGGRCWPLLIRPSSYQAMCHQSLQSHHPETGRSISEVLFTKCLQQLTRRSSSTVSSLKSVNTLTMSSPPPHFRHAC